MANIWSKLFAYVAICTSTTPSDVISLSSFFPFSGTERIALFCGYGHWNTPWPIWTGSRLGFDGILYSVSRNYGQDAMLVATYSCSKTRSMQWPSR